MKYPRYKYVLATCDFTIILLSFITAGYFTEDVLNKNIIIYENIFLTYSVFLFFSVVFIFIFQNNYLYKINIFLTRAPHLIALIRSFLYGSLTLIIFSFLIKFDLLLSSRVFVLSFLFIGLLSVIFVRLLILRPFYMNFKKILDNSNILIVGAEKSGKLLAEKLIFENFYGMHIAGFLDDKISKGKVVLNGIEVLGTINDLKRVTESINVNEIIIAVDDIDYEGLMQLIDKCNSLEKSIKLTSELFNVVPEKIVTEVYSGIPVVDLSPRVNKTLNYIYKRIFDYAGAALGIIVLLPLFIFISFLIKLTSPGKILHTHTRIGKDGTHFRFYKFRTMEITENGDITREERMKEFIKNDIPYSSGNTKIISENRITPAGKFLRKTSLDELPQLFNVLKGEMSLVGPRPCLPYEYELFDDWHKRRHSVLPGCTGVWQVSGRSSVSFKDSVVLDLYYINNMTPWLDLQLIFKTVPVMLFGRGAK